MTGGAVVPKANNPLKLPRGASSLVEIGLSWADNEEKRHSIHSTILDEPSTVSTKQLGAAIANYASLSASQRFRECQSAIAPWLEAEIDRCQLLLGRLQFR